MAELENIKTFYLQHITNLYHKKTNNSVLMTRQDYQAKLERLLVLENSMVTKTSSDYRILKVCDILITDSDGTQIPKLCRRGTNLLFVYIEELFEIVHNAHLLLKHAGRNCLQRYFRDKYCNITKDCIMSYLITCKNCPRKKRIIIRSAGRKRPNKSDEEDECDDHNEQFFQPLTGNPHQSSSSREPSTNQVAENGNSGVARVVSTTPLHIPLFKAHRGEQRQDESFTRGQVDVFNMQKEPDGEFNWILRYINLTTHEVRLRPLRSGTAHETADLLVDIYCEQGAPVVLQSLNGRNFAEEVIREVVKIWPQCRQLHSYMKKMSSNESSENLLINQLSQLMKRHETNSWAGMLRYLQWELNTAYSNTIDRAPIENSLGKIPTLGLKTSKLLDAIYDNARSEEEIMEYLQDAELLRLSAFCSSSCQTPESSSSNKSSRLTEHSSLYMDTKQLGSVNSLGVMNALSDPTISPSVCSTSSNIAALPTHYDLSLSTGRNHLMELDDKSILSQPNVLNMPPNSQDINHSQHSFIGYSNISANETLACNSSATKQMDVSMPTNSMSSHLTQPYIHHSQSIYHEANNSMMSRMDEQQQSNSSLELSTTGPTSNTVKSEMNLAQASPVCATGINPNNLLAMEVNNCIVDRGGMNC